MQCYHRMLGLAMLVTLLIQIQVWHPTNVHVWVVLFAIVVVNK